MLLELNWPTLNIPEICLYSSVFTYTGPCVCVCVCAKLLQSCLTLCKSDCSPPGSSDCRTSQARMLEWLPCSSPEDLPDPGIKPASPAAPALQADSLLLSHWEAHTDL